jgi:hypothetical protein
MTTIPAPMKLSVAFVTLSLVWFPHCSSGSSSEEERFLRPELLADKEPLGFEGTYWQISSASAQTGRKPGEIFQFLGDGAVVVAFQGRFINSSLRWSYNPGTKVFTLGSHTLELSSNTKVLKSPSLVLTRLRQKPRDVKDF